MRKPAALIFAVFFLSLASATVDDVSFEQIPSAWETGENLEFKMESTGSNLDIVFFQSREPGEPGFTDRGSKICSNFNRCDWSFQHTEEEPRTFEYRFWAWSNYGDEEASRTQEITYYNNLDYSVEWTDRPPKTSSENSQISMSVTAHDSASRFDEEGVLHLQYRKPGGGWESFDTRRCSNSYSDDTCSNHGSTVLNDEKLDDGSSRFRGKVVFKGGVSTVSSTETTSLTKQGAVNSVNINDLPEEVEDGSSFEIRADSTGQNLQNLYIQEKDPDEPGWTDWRSTDCGGESDCSLNRNYQVDGTGEKEFRAYAEAPGDSDSSGIEYVNFVQPEKVERVDSIILEELPDRKKVEEDLEIIGEAEGENLDEIVLKTRERYESWSKVASDGCSGNNCDFEYDFETSEIGDLSFKLVAKAGESSKDSNIEVVEFYEEKEYRVDDVDLDNLPSSHPTGEHMDVTGDADGENLERIILQKRDPNDEWEDVETDYCGESSSCEFEDTYQQGDEDEVDFRLKAEAGEDSDYSNRETVDFEDADDIDSVSIDNLPSEHGVDEDLEISGEAEGENLETLIIQEKDSNDDDWDEWRSTDCDRDDYCEINRDFSTNSEGDKDFRIKAETDDDTDYSSVETVDFIEETVEGNVDSVSIDNLPSQYSTDSDIEIRGEAEGEKLDSIIIQEKDSDEDNWYRYRERDCDNEDYCEISRDFSINYEEEKDFRIKAEAGDDSDVSSTETVDFIEDDGEIDSVDINDLPEEVEEEESFQIDVDSTGENLQRLYIQERDSGENEWDNWRSRDCHGEDECSLSRTYTAGGTGEKDFRAYIEVLDDSRSSGVETVEFIPRTIYRVDSVVLEELPDRKNIAENLNIGGDAEGRNLDEIILKTRERYQSWSEIASSDCSGNSECSFSHEFEPTETGDLSFKLTAISNGRSQDSNIEVVEFYEEEEYRIDSISIDNLPENHPTGEALGITGGASGENIERVILQKRDPGSDWTNIETVNCFESSSCNFDENYQQNNEEEVDFRLRAESGGSSETSGIETVVFEDDQDDGGEEDIVDQVSIDSLPIDYPVGSSLQVGGDASGGNLDSIIIQIREDGSWSNYRTKNCNDGSSCTISKSYTSTDTGEKDFRIRAEAGGESDVSHVETVEFYTITKIDSIGIDELPDSEFVNTQLEISGSMSGENLDRLEVQKKRRYSDWSTIDSKNCGGTSCTLTTGYTEENEGSVSFRFRGTAGGQEEFSGIETVDYVRQISPEIGDVTLENIPEELETGETVSLNAESSGESLDSLRINYREGSDTTWDALDSRSCTGSSCDLSTSYSTDTAQTVQFRAESTAGTNKGYSMTRSTDFVDPSDPEAISLETEMEPTPERSQTGNGIILEASGNGENLERLEIQGRNSSEQSWTTLKEEDCNSLTQCSTAKVYTSEESGEVFFRSRISNSTDSTASIERSTIFYTESRISSVSIDELVDEYPMEQELEVSGNAEGSNLNQLVLQVKESRYGEWNMVESRDCTDQESCSLESEYLRESPGESSFRFYAIADGDRSYSGIEVVDFHGEDDQDLEVSIEDLPGDYPLDEDLEISAEASGESLDSLRIQERERYESWDDIYEEDCEDEDYCEADTDFETSDEGEVEFRAVVEAGEDKAYSGTEVVDFESDGFQEDSNLWVKVENEDGKDLEDARVRVRNGDSETGYTDNDGEVEFELEPDDYEVRASKSGYETEERDVDIDEDETRSIRFRLERLDDFEVSVTHEDEVCRGEDLKVDVQVSNMEDRRDSFEIFGSGLGGETDARNINIDEDETEEVNLVFRNVKDEENGDFTVRVENSRTRIESRSVDVKDCVERETRDRNLPQGLSARVTPEVLAGEKVKVSGDVQGVSEPVNVKVEAGDFSKTVSSTRSGGYTVFFSPEQVGLREVEISSGGFTKKRQVRVLPRASVSRIDTPDKVVEGSEFRICGEVKSDVDAEVMLFRDGEKLDSKEGSERVCFDTQAGEEGEKDYRIQASTYGQTGSAGKLVEVIEAGEEFDRFPGQITVKKTEPGQARIELYNKEKGVAEYRISVENMDDSWVSQTEKNVVLPQGDRERVYLYFSPERSGEFNPEIVIERNSKEAFRRKIAISSQSIGNEDRFLKILDGFF